MAAPEYHLTTHWRVRGTAQEVFDILSDAEDLPRWWPAAFSDSLGIQSGEESGRPKVTRLEGRGFLPGKLRWHQVTTTSEPPHRLVAEIWGDVEGTGTWTLEGSGEPATDWCEITYDWVVTPRMMFAATLSPLIEKILTANHRWAMAKGEQSLQIEIDRRHAERTPGPSLVQTPPEPAKQPKWVVPFALGAAFAVITAKRRQNSSKAQAALER